MIYGSDKDYCIPCQTQWRKNDPLKACTPTILPDMVNFLYQITIFVLDLRKDHKKEEHKRGYVDKQWTGFLETLKNNAIAVGDK